MFIRIKKIFSSFFSRRFPFFSQLETMDCGPACLKMIAAYYGKIFSLNYLREVCHINRTGISMQGLAAGAGQLGMEVMAVKIPFEGTGNDAGLTEAPLPAVAYWNQNHFVVVFKINKSHVFISDPARGRLKLRIEDFKKNWVSDESERGIVMMLEPGDIFFDNADNAAAEKKDNRKSLSFFFQYLRPYRKYLGIIIFTLLLSSLLQLLFPFLTKSMVDVGISEKNINFIVIILLAQLTIYFGQTVISFFQRWVLLHLSSRINILLSSDFLYKITRLPIGFFDSKMFGDVYQRINDHRKVESFFTASTISIIFSFFSLLVFSIVLLIYNPLIFLIFIAGSVLYISWIFFFLRKRKIIDYQMFHEYARNNDLLYELVYGMQEIKLQNSEQKRALQWTEAQERLFRINIRSNTITQYQDGGAFFINQLKDILITIVAATAVIQDRMSLGMLLATQFIIGQLNGPIQQIIAFIRAGFEAKLSLDRIVEIHEKKEEWMEFTAGNPVQFDAVVHADVELQNVCFRYNLLGDFVIKDVSFIIPKGKVTAIVGASGSGKTTLIKMLLGFYRPETGNILAGGVNLTDYAPPDWRRKCGAVMQDGYIFSDSIFNNITECDDVPNTDHFNNAIVTANIKDYISSQPLKGNTLVGNRGNGMSQGQKQRLLIARAVYKNPDYLFFDEATNALDARNEKVIMENLSGFFEGRTVVIVAHRLSTVRNADQIIVMESGRIIEQGVHGELVKAGGAYYELVRNQLELGK